MSIGTGGTGTAGIETGNIGTRGPAFQPHLAFQARLASRQFDVRLDISAGETVAVLGPNGAGKSTLLSLLAGLVKPDDGAATLAGSSLFGDGTFTPPHRRGVCLLAQDPALFPHLSVLENVAFGPRSAGAGRRRSRLEAERWLADVDATALAARKPGQLSGGQAQRVAVARALAAGPELLLLDEPMAALDVTVAPILRRTLRTVLRDRTAIIVTHDVLDALMLADRIVVLDGGTIVEQGRTRDVLERPRSAFAAGLAGLNLLTGTASRSGLVTDDGRSVFAAAPSGGGTAAGPVVEGAAAAVFDPRAVSVFLEHPADASPRNFLKVRITDLEPHGQLISVRAGHLAAEITAVSAAELDLVPGMDVYFAVKSTEVTLYPL